MILEEYLKNLEHCPDESLPDNFGISDNWPIFLRANANELVRNLRESGKYRLIDIREGKARKRYTLNYLPGTVKLKIFNRLLHIYLTGREQEKTFEEHVHSERQIENYNTTLVLTPYQKKKIPLLTWQRALVIVINDIAGYIAQKNIHACFPRSLSWHEKDLSKIVYYPTEGNNETGIF